MRKKISSKLKALDLFCGCGGLTLGLKKAEFRVIGAVEIDMRAAATYRANHPDVYLKQQDIRTISAKVLMRELGIRRYELDLLAGCPPCQGFSSLRTQNGARRNRDVRNDLVHEMLRFAKAFRPKTIMMENVPKLVRHKPFRDLCEGLLHLGYTVDFSIKEASKFGVPQRRRRLILLASRKGKISFAAEHTQIKTVRGAIGNLPKPGTNNDSLHSSPTTRRSGRVERFIRDIPKNGGESI